VKTLPDSSDISNCHPLDVYWNMRTLFENPAKTIELDSSTVMISSHGKSSLSFSSQVVELPLFSEIGVLAIVDEARDVMSVTKSLACKPFDAVKKTQRKKS
jgi:hypothetical protein